MNRFLWLLPILADLLTLGGLLALVPFPAYGPFLPGAS